MGKPDASRTLRFELNRLDLADMTVKPHTIKIVAPTPDIAGLLKELWGGCIYMRDSNTNCVVDPKKTDALLAKAADTLERQAAEIERLRGALTMAKGPLGSTGPTPVYEAVLAALTGEDT